MKKLLALVFAILALTMSTVNIVSALDEAANDDIRVWVDGVPLVERTTIPLAIFAGETVPVRVGFSAAKDAEDVRIKIEVRGYADDLEVRSERFDIIDGNFYTKSMPLQFPYDLDDELSNVVKIKITIYNDDCESVTERTLEIQRESYQVDVLSVDTDSEAIAGQPFAVDVVLKNRGIRNLEDLFVTARIPALGIERRAYFSDIFALDDEDRTNVNLNDDDEDEQDSVSGRIYLMIPEDAKSGMYALEVSVKNDDVTANAVREVQVNNKFSGESVVVSTISKTFSAGEEAAYELLIVNPSSTLKVYSIVPETSRSLSVQADQSVIAVPAGSSKTIVLNVMSSEEGTQNFGVNVYSGNVLVKRAELTANVREAQNRTAITGTNPVVVLTIVLAIVFVVLLVVLIALLGRKPQKTEEFGESYY